jgi:1-deoxy-D-xylulose-5-phosphate synthase
MYLAPTCRAEFEAMLNWSIAQDKAPVAIRTASPAPVDLDITVDSDYSELNKFRVVSEGSDVAIIAVGTMLADALKAAELLKAKGINPTIINPRFVSGVDAELLTSLMANHRAVVTVEDGIIDGGFGAKVAHFYADKDIKVDVIGLPKQFYDRYNPQELCERYDITAEGIARRVQRL